MKKTLLVAGGLTLLAACFALVTIVVPDISAHTIAAIGPLDHGAISVDLAMATLAVNALRDYQLGDTEEYPVIADDIIYQGAAVGENASGYSRPLQAGDPFQGFAEAMADNAGGAAGAVNVNVKARGRVVLAISGIGITANDRPVVYASDDNTFTLTASTNSPIGRVSRWVSTGVAVVEFDASMAAEIVARAAGDV